MALTALRFEEEAFVEERERLVKLEADVGHIKDDLKHVEAKIDRLETKVDAGFQRLDRKIDDKSDLLDRKMDYGFEKVNERIDKKFLWMLNALGGAVVLIVGFIYFYFGKLSVGSEQTAANAASTPASMSAPAPVPASGPPRVKQGSQNAP